MEVVGLATTLVLFIAWVYAGLVNRQNLEQSTASDILFYPFLLLKIFCIVWLAYTLWRSIKARMGH